MIEIGLVGDRDDTVPAHRAIPEALALAASALHVAVDARWVATDSIDRAHTLSALHGIWCVPASPYRSMAGALGAIRFARERQRAFLGTCGGFQHAVVEYARNVLGWKDAEHAETAPEASVAVITALECALVGATGGVRLDEGSRLARAYAKSEAEERYRCRYGVNPRLLQQLIGGSLRATAWDGAGEIRGLELDDHPFFVLTLFQPELAALDGTLPPLVAAFVEASAAVEAELRSARHGR